MAGQYQAYHPPQNCKCPKCSQGFCHFCEELENVVWARREHEAYDYHDGCGLMDLPKTSSIMPTIQASACEKHLRAGRGRGAR
jgi:hypothetical protein